MPKEVRKPPPPTTLQNIKETSKYVNPTAAPRPNITKEIPKNGSPSSTSRPNVPSKEASKDPLISSSRTVAANKNSSTVSPQKVNVMIDGQKNSKVNKDAKNSSVNSSHNIISREGSRNSLPVLTTVQNSTVIKDTPKNSSLATPTTAVKDNKESTKNATVVTSTANTIKEAPKNSQVTATSNVIKEAPKNATLVTSAANTIKEIPKNCTSVTSAANIIKEVPKNPIHTVTSAANVSVTKSEAKNPLPLVTAASNNNPIKESANNSFFKPITTTKETSKSSSTAVPLSPVITVAKDAPKALRQNTYTSIELYYTLGSTPCHAVLLLIRTLGLEVNLRHVSLEREEHRSPEFMKLNPQLTVPTIYDQGFAAGESRAILGYLVDQYAKDDSLYPKEPKKKALVNQRLFFEAGTMDKAFVEYFRGKAAKLFDAFDILDKLLEGNKWLAGEKKTIADFSMVSSVASIEVAGFDIGKYPNVVDWYQNIQTTFPGYDETVGEGCAALKKYLESLNKL